MILANNTDGDDGNRTKFVAVRYLSHRPLCCGELHVMPLLNGETRSSKTEGSLHAPPDLRTHGLAGVGSP